MIRLILFTIVSIVWAWYIYVIYFKKDIDQNVLNNPVQILNNDLEAYSVELGSKKMDIKNVADFTIWGIITSISGQSLVDQNNVVNICIMWGENLLLHQYGSYQSWHKNGICNLKLPKEYSQLFEVRKFSNNHILLPTTSLINKAKSLNVGDQIKISGDLVNVREHDTKTWLNTSIIREDVGDGACEIILAKEIEVLVSNKREGAIAIHILLFLLVIVIYLFSRKIKVNR